MSNSLEYSTLPRSAAPGLPCPSCRFANPPGFRFCGACGSGLAADGERPIRPRQVTAERRQLTVLFCDLVGSTHLANSLELEELRDVIRSYQAACAESVRRYGGMISRFMGDGILVLFGYPQAHEDDAERAVRAALGMVDAVARLPRPAAVTEPLTARVGIASGVVVAGDLIGDGSAEEEAVLGETVNLAGRLQAVAEPGNVVVAQGTHALLGGRFVCDDLGAHSLKGFGEPVACWRVVRPRPVVQPVHGRGRRHPRTAVRAGGRRGVAARPLAVGGRRSRAGRRADGRGRDRQVPRRGGRVRTPGRRLRPAALPVLTALHEPRAAPGDPPHRAGRADRPRGSGGRQAREALGLVGPGGRGAAGTGDAGSASVDSGGRRPRRFRR